MLRYLFEKREEKQITPMQNGRNENLSHLASYTVNPTKTFSTGSTLGEHERKK